MSPAVRKAACSWRLLVVLVLLGVVALQVLLNGYVHIAGTGRPHWPYGGSSRLIREGLSRDIGRQWETARRFLPSYGRTVVPPPATTQTLPAPTSQTFPSGSHLGGNTKPKSGSNRRNCARWCPHILVGPLIVDVKGVSKFRDIAKKNPEVRPGGRWNPPYCKSRHKVAVIVPYRDREQHLRIFLKHMHPVLKRQQLDYGIYIVEQYGEPKFNRAMLFNIGFKEALKEYDYDCFIFHDVDLIPEDDRNIYSCPDTPKHMSVAVDEMNYKLPYDGIFGGICALSTVHFQRVNGFSNSFWGWGGEDDDMANRLTAHSLYVMRPPAEIARYKMIPHRKAKPSPDRIQKLKTGRDRYGTDGLNSLEYELLALSHQPLFTYIAAKLERTADPTEESWIPSWLFTNSAKSFVDMWKKNWAELKRKPLDNDTISRYQKNWKERKPNKFKPYGGDRKSRYVVSNTTREEDIRNFIRRDGTFATTTQSQTKRLGHAARITNQQQAPSYRGNVQTNRLSQNSSMQQADQTLYKTPVLDTIGKSQIPQTRMHAYRGPNGTLDRKGKVQADRRKKYRPKSQQRKQPQTWHRVHRYDQRPAR
ncbi:PREDICTED: beta-1,4-galactosyltransferase 1-like [Branchiostoma belcheri]|uniref:Beta-1,4-galactosyltransferase 1-like n=1 Tax=Branchiostoma belcheri TaxID=7741 RepID=A0A6P4YMW2_BRABE|nr:PREDICTED: beta-1,4-galactosyltransferase 1-like [Branchiostoma belcheri]